MILGVGSKLGPYEIITRIGAGGMGEVWKAREARLGRSVAIKVLREDLSSDKEWLVRFEKEARLASALNHPNIITIYQIGEAAGAPYFVMEFVEGRTLRQLLNARRLLLPEILALASQIASGLAKAHSAGITHRDLKPENIMISADGFVKILDFGLGKLTPPQIGESSLTTLLPVELETERGTILGTVDYMSPEQARGEGVDYRSDQFSFGSVLYEMLTGARPFRRDSAIQSLAAIIESKPKPVATLVPEVPKHLVQILERCLEKARERRYLTTQELSAAISALQTDTGKKNATWPRSRRRRPPLRVAILVAALVIAGILGALAVGDRQDIFQSLQARLGILAPLPEKRNVLILPFRAVSNGVENQALADGLTEVLSEALMRLTTLPALQVVPASETRRLAIQTPERAKMEFGSNLAVQGDFKWRGAKILVQCTLIDTATQNQLRDRRITANVDELDKLPDMVFKALAQMLAFDLGSRQHEAFTALHASAVKAEELHLRGRGYLQRYNNPKNVDSAIRAFEQALALAPKYALASASLGEAFWLKFGSTGESGWVDRARNACMGAVAFNAALPSGHTCLGRIFAGTGRYQDAIREYQAALATEPTNDDIYRQLADAFLKADRGEDAEKLYLRAIEFRPHYWAGYNWLGGLCNKQARYAEAANNFAQVITLAPDNYRGYSNLGAVRLTLGEYNDAINLLERSVAIRPTNGNYSNLGTAYFFRGRFSAAEKAYQDALRLDDSDHVVWGNLGDAYYCGPGTRPQAMEAYRTAIAKAEPKLKTESKNILLLSQAAIYHAMIEDREQALSLLDKALGLSPRDPYACYAAGVIYNKSRDVDVALGWLTKAVVSGFSRTAIRDTPLFDNLWGNPRFQDLLRGR